MTYQEWANQYFDTADKLKNIMEDLKKKEKTASIGEKENIRSSIPQIYSMYLECVKTGNLLNSRSGNFNL